MNNATVIEQGDPGDESPKERFTLGAALARIEALENLLENVQARLGEDEIYNLSERIANLEHRLERKIEQLSHDLRNEAYYAKSDLERRINQVENNAQRGSRW